MTHYIVTIRDGQIIDTLDMRVLADSEDAAEEIGERIVAAIDPSAYVDAVHEAA